MPKKVLIISSSLRGGSNSEILAGEVAKGALAAGHEVEIASLKGKEIKFCIGCLSCQKTLKCVHRDDANAIVAKIRDADAVVFANPLYYYELSGALKTLLDRCNPLYPAPYLFREIYYLGTSADDAEDAHDRAVEGLKGWIECFPEAKFGGALICGGLEGPKEAAASEERLQKAFEFGKSL